MNESCAPGHRPDGGAPYGALATRIARPLWNERGSVLILALIVVMLLAAIAGAVIMIGSDEGLIEAQMRRQTRVRYAAEYGLEVGLSLLNRNGTLLPDSGYRTIMDRSTITDADGNELPVSVRVYLGRTGSAVGEMGKFASLVAEAQQAGTRVVKRLEVIEESFAKYAYFTDREGPNIGFGGGDEILGPLHSNDDVRIWSSGARFRDEFTTSGRILGKSYGTFDFGYEEYVSPIALPDMSDQSRLRGLAAGAGYVFRAPTQGGSSSVKMRIEFVAIDVNGDGDDSDDGEGFFRIYRTPNHNWLRADWQTINYYDNCGDYHQNAVTGDSRFIAANLHDELAGQDWVGIRHGVSGSGRWWIVRRRALSSGTARCFLGGDPSLTLDGVSFPAWNGLPSSAGWLRRQDFAPGAALPTALAGRPDADFLFPLHRLYNQGFRGVIFVDGTVAVSGRLNGRVTLASTATIVVLDDLTYVTPPNTGPCRDILGLIAWRDIALADNALNTPQFPPGSSRRRTYDESTAETIHSVLMALNTSFYVERYRFGPRREERCESRSWGRGCLYIAGGLIQGVRGAVGTTAGTGYIKRYIYDQNARFCPPPHFPTTGRYHRNRYYEVDPVRFDPASYFQRLRG
jgi:hypothetical protein